MGEDHVGPTRTVIVTYLLPCMALVYGTLLLHETVSINALAGLAFVLLGIFLIGRTRTTHAPAHDQSMQPIEQIPSTERIIS
jgi:drug/metabolite transporter (DMT)-like permease